MITNIDYMAVSEHHAQVKELEGTAQVLIAQYEARLSAYKDENEALREINKSLLKRLFK